MRVDSEMQARAFVPWLTRALAVANVSVFALMALAGVDVLHPRPLAYIEWGSNFAPLTATGEWWRLASAVFLHFGPLHLLFNTWALWVIGPPVERLFGHGRFALIYATAGLGGSLASIAWNPLVNSAGASGAIFGVIGAQLAFFMRRDHRIPAEVIRAQRNSTLAFIAYSVVFGFVVSGIDNAAHVGGLLSGLGIGWLIARPLGAAGEPRRERAGLLLAALLAVAVVSLGVAAAQNAAARHAAEQGYLRDWREYAAEEPGVLAGMKAVVSGARNRRLDDGQVVGWLEGTGIPFYRGAARRLGGHALPRQSPLAEEQARAVGFVQRRAAGLELLASGIRERDRDRVEQALGQLSGPAQGQKDAGDG